VEILTNISEETHCIYFTFILEMEAVWCLEAVDKTASITRRINLEDQHLN
jgi:hypothetical protein